MLACFLVFTEGLIGLRKRQSNGCLHQRLILKAVPDPFGGSIQDRAHRQFTIGFPIRTGRAKQVVVDEIIDRFADRRFIPGAFLRPKSVGRLTLGAFLCAKSVGRFVPCAFLQARRIGCFSV